MRITSLAFLVGLFLLALIIPGVIGTNAASTMGEILSEAAVQPNAPPVAEPDSYTVHGGLLVTPIENDHDPDSGDSISTQGIITQPQHGTLIRTMRTLSPMPRRTRTPDQIVSRTESATARVRAPMAPLPSA